MRERERPHNVEVTLGSYERGAESYLRHSPQEPHSSLVAFRERVLEQMAPRQRLLELGTGPGRDAAFFEARGIVVQRSDGAQAFVSRLREQGHDARLLDVTRDELGQDFDAIFANAVLLHLNPGQLAALLERAGEAVRPGGLLAFTVKEGEGEIWSEEKELRRYFRFWREPELRQLLERSGWPTASIDRVQGPRDRWLQVICRSAARRAPD